MSRNPLFSGQRKFGERPDRGETEKGGHPAWPPRRTGTPMMAYPGLASEAGKRSAASPGWGLKRTATLRQLRRVGKLLVTTRRIHCGHERHAHPTKLRQGWQVKPHLTHLRFTCNLAPANAGRRLRGKDNSNRFRRSPQQYPRQASYSLSASSRSSAKRQCARRPCSKYLPVCCLQAGSVASQLRRVGTLLVPTRSEGIHGGPKRHAHSTKFQRRARGEREPFVQWTKEVPRTPGQG